MLLTPRGRCGPWWTSHHRSIKLKDLLLHYAMDVSLWCVNDDPTSAREETIRRDHINLTLDLSARNPSGVDPVALDAPIVCQVSIPPTGATSFLAGLQSGSHLLEVAESFLKDLFSADSHVGLQLALPCL